MPTGADKKDQDHDHWRKREVVWAGWGDQEAYDKKMAETKEKRDAACEVHEANQKKRQEELEVASSTPHVTERQEKGSDGNVSMIRRHTVRQNIGCACVRHRLWAAFCSAFRIN